MVVGAEVTVGFAVAVGAGVMTGVATAVGAEVAIGVAAAVGAGVMTGVATAVGTGVMTGVAAAVGVEVAIGVAAAVGALVSAGQVTAGQAGLRGHGRFPPPKVAQGAWSMRQCQWEGRQFALQAEALATPNAELSSARQRRRTSVFFDISNILS